MLVTVSKQGANIGGRVAVYFLYKRLDSAEHILSIAKRIQLEVSYDIITDVFFISTKFWRRTNKESANVFTSMRKRHLWQYPDE